MEDKILKELQEIIKELQDIRSILEPKEISVKFVPEDSVNGKHYIIGNSGLCEIS